MICMEKIRLFLEFSEIGTLAGELEKRCTRRANFRRWRSDIRLVPLQFVKSLFESEEEFWKFLEGKRLLSYAHKEDMIFDSKIDEEISYFLGWLLTDGHIRKGRAVIAITQKFKEPLEKLKRILIKKYSINESHFIIRFSRREWRLGIYSSPLKFVLLEYFKIPSGCKHAIIRVPEQILRSESNNNKFAFLSGVLEGDGHVGSSNQWKGYHYPKIEILMKNENFLEDMSKLTESLGIRCTKFKCSDGTFCLGIKSKESFEAVYRNISMYLSHPKKIRTFSELINQKPVKNVTVK